MSLMMAKEDRETADGFRDVRDPTGKLLFRVLACGILEIKTRSGLILVNLWEYLDPPRRD
jgi:hypothetical protein